MILVTGATGFIGRHVVAALADRGCRVVALQHRTELPADVQSRCERVVSGDIRDPDIQKEALQNVRSVCHLSAYIPARINDLAEAPPCYLINAQATLELGAAAANQGVRRFVYMSTGNMYAPSATPRTEDDNLFPVEYATGYFVSKLAAELYLTHIAKRTTMEVLILRVASPYGPGEPREKVIPNFLRLAAQGQELRIVNGGRARYNFVYVTDVAECVVKALDHGDPGVYNVASGEHTSVRELTEAIVELFAERAVPLHVEPETPGSFAGFPALSIEKARRTWGFAPRSLAAGLREYQATIARDAG